LIKKLQPELSAMTGKLLNFGEEAGKAAAIKLTGNLFLVAFNGAIADTIAFSSSMGISTNELSQLFADWNPGASLPSRLKRMTSDDFSDPSWRLEMARKDTGLFLQEAELNNIDLHVIPGVAKLMDVWLDKGHGKDDWTIIGKKK
ncbi:MAG: NAD(P)-dependent oxidoreductase, partial [Ginsengibacter sp.]